MAENSRRKIYAINMMQKLEQSEKGWPVFGAERLVGWYADKETAFEDVKNNALDICECLYRYAIVEEVGEGLYQPAGKEKRWLFVYDPDTETYHEMEEPEWMKTFCGFTIG